MDTIQEFTSLINSSIVKDELNHWAFVFSASDSPSLVLMQPVTDDDEENKDDDEQHKRQSFAVAVTSKGTEEPPVETTLDIIFSLVKRFAQGHNTSLAYIIHRTISRTVIYPSALDQDKRKKFIQCITDKVIWPNQVAEPSTDVMTNPWAVFRRLNIISPWVSLLTRMQSASLDWIRLQTKTSSFTLRHDHVFTIGDQKFDDIHDVVSLLQNMEHDLILVELWKAGETTPEVVKVPNDLLQINGSNVVSSSDHPSKVITKLATTYGFDVTWKRSQAGRNNILGSFEIWMEYTDESGNKMQFPSNWQFHNQEQHEPAKWVITVDHPKCSAEPTYGFCMMLSVFTTNRPAYIDYISADGGCRTYSLPGKPLGPVLVKMAVDLCKMVGVQQVELTDASAKPCGRRNIRIRLSQIFEYGKGWYDRVAGFHPTDEYVDEVSERLHNEYTVEDLQLTLQETEVVQQRIKQSDPNMKLGQFMTQLLKEDCKLYAIAVNLLQIDMNMRDDIKIIERQNDLIVDLKQ